jgi:BolA protein
MNRTDIIKDILEARFQPHALHVTDDSHTHAGHAGARPEGSTHFSVEIVAEAFRGLTRVASHRLVYDVLAAHFAQGLHALAITATAPKEL